LAASFNQARDDGYRPIELLPIVPPAALHIPPAEILQIGLHPDRIVDAIQKDGLHAPRPFPCQELISRTIEFEKKYVGAGCEAAVWILHTSTGRIGAFKRLFQTLDGARGGCVIACAVNAPFGLIEDRSRSARIEPIEFTLHDDVLGALHSRVRLSGQRLHPRKGVVERRLRIVNLGPRLSQMR
jgi:hypothetical protein